ncbi:sensor histidine kinase [Hyphococcus luteus]|uniref:histidine kinase n=1 Tax=Hyphococcus luteus TaxID=2058213 RepID=A0A2S7KA49_9PROT|nr:ATP-binding protein [Marinicaulis flavus]PQA89375.1 hypothetical protein CW354_00415 [Marinicaulis flavus]
MDSLLQFFSTDNFMPHGHCYLWLPHILWLHVASDALIAMAYFAIPLALFRLARRRPDFGLNRTIYLFVGFIILCGLTHVMEIYTIWEPVYFQQGLIKALTAIVSVATAIAVWPLLPKLVAAPSLSQLEKANAKLERANAALKVSEARLELAVNAGGVGLWDWDIKTGEDWFSKVWLAHLGYQPGEVDYHFSTWEALLHPEDRERVMKELDAHIETGAAYKPQFRMRTKSGDYIWVEAFGEASRDEQGAPARMAGTLIDITAQKQRELENENNRLFLQSVLENVQDGIVACDEQGKLTLFNFAARRAHGMDAHEIDPKEWCTYYDLYEPDGETPLALHRAPLFRAMKGEMIECQEIVIAPKDLPVRRFLVKAMPLSNAEGKQIGAVAALHEVTVEREREEALRRSNIELEQFARVASHDLQEPLRKLITFSEFLKEDLGGVLNERVQADIDAISDSASRMKQLVSDILELSRLKGNEGPPEKVSPRACIETVMLRLSEGSLKGAEFSYEELPDVLADATLLTQVYQNLIVNALKFMPANRRPKISFTATTDGRTVVLGVKDNGIGIDPELEDYVFQPLSRLHSRDDYEGTGIGLAICKKAIERMGGRIWVAGGDDEGAHFKFELKAAVNSAID